MARRVGDDGIASIAMTTADMATLLQEDLVSQALASCFGPADGDLSDLLLSPDIRTAGTVGARSFVFNQTANSLELTTTGSITSLESPLLSIANDSAHSSQKLSSASDRVDILDLLEGDVATLDLPATAVSEEDACSSSNSSSNGNNNNSNQLVFHFEVPFPSASDEDSSGIQEEADSLARALVEKALDADRKKVLGAKSTGDDLESILDSYAEVSANRVLERLLDEVVEQAVNDAATLAVHLGSSGLAAFGRTPDAVSAGDLLQSELERLATEVTFDLSNPSLAVAVPKMFGLYRPETFISTDDDFVLGAKDGLMTRTNRSKTSRHVCSDACSSDERVLESQPTPPIIEEKHLLPSLPPPRPPPPPPPRVSPPTAHASSPPRETANERRIRLRNEERRKRNRMGILVSSLKRKVYHCRCIDCQAERRSKGEPEPTEAIEVRELSLDEGLASIPLVRRSGARGRPRLYPRLEDLFLMRSRGREEREEVNEAGKISTADSSWREDPEGSREEGRRLVRGPSSLETTEKSRGRNGDEDETRNGGVTGKAEGEETNSEMIEMEGEKEEESPLVRRDEVGGGEMSDGGGGDNKSRQSVMRPATAATPSSRRMGESNLRSAETSTGEDDCCEEEEREEAMLEMKAEAGDSGDKTKSTLETPRPPLARCYDVGTSTKASQNANNLSENVEKGISSCRYHENRTVDRQIPIETIYEEAKAPFPSPPTPVPTMPPSSPPTPAPNMPRPPPSVSSSSDAEQPFHMEDDEPDSLVDGDDGSGRNNDAVSTSRGTPERQGDLSREGAVTRGIGLERELPEKERGGGGGCLRDQKRDAETGDPAAAAEPIPTCHRKKFADSENGTSSDCSSSSCSSGVGDQVVSRSWRVSITKKEGKKLDRGLRATTMSGEAAADGDEAKSVNVSLSLLSSPKSCFVRLRRVEMRGGTSLHKVGGGKTSSSEKCPDKSEVTGGGKVAGGRGRSEINGSEQSRWGIAETKTSPNLEMAPPPSLPSPPSRSGGRKRRSPIGEVNNRSIDERGEKWSRDEMVAEGRALVATSGTDPIGCNRRVQEPLNSAEDSRTKKVFIRRQLRLPTAPSRPKYDLPGWSGFPCFANMGKSVAASPSSAGNVDECLSVVSVASGFKRRGRRRN